MKELLRVGQGELKFMWMSTPTGTRPNLAQGYWGDNGRLNLDGEEPVGGQAYRGFEARSVLL